MQTILQLIISFLITCLIGYFWLRLLQHIFLQDKKKFGVKMAIWSLILVGSLYLFSWIVSSQGLTVESGISRVSSFILYVSLLFLFFIFRNKQQRNQHLRFLALIWVVLLAIVGILGLQYGLQWVLLLMIWAYVEEFLKITTSEIEVKKSDFYSSDVLIFSVLVAGGFSVVENVLYFFQKIFLDWWEWLVAMLFGRWIFSSGLHFLATGVIALTLFKLYQNTKVANLPLWQKILRVILCMIIGVSLHFLYNFSISVGRSRVYVIVLIWGYFLLSYLMFLSDRLYRDR